MMKNFFHRVEEQFLPKRLRKEIVPADEKLQRYSRIQKRRHDFCVSCGHPVNSQWLLAVCAGLSIGRTS